MERSGDAGRGRGGEINEKVLGAARRRKVEGGEKRTERVRGKKEEEKGEGKMIRWKVEP